MSAVERGQPYHLARCRLCGRLFLFCAHDNPQISAPPDLPADFWIEAISLTVQGVCGRCYVGPTSENNNCC